MGAANRGPDRKDAGKRQFAFLHIKSSDGKGRGDLPKSDECLLPSPAHLKPTDMKQLLKR